MTDAAALGSVHDLRAAHADAPWPDDLPVDAQVEGIALVLLDADVSALADAFLAAGGALRPDQWWTLRESAADARTVLPHLAGDAWLRFGRLYALAQAMLRLEPRGA